MDKKIILVGGFHEIIELCENIGYTIIGIIDNNIEDHYLNYPILGRDEDAYEILKKNTNIPLVITPDSPLIREKLFNYYSNIGFNFETIISLKANISKSSSIGVGSIIQDGVNISANTSIGNFVKLNTNCNIMHDCTVNNFVTIAPNAVVLGRIFIHKNAYIGANSTILPDKIIAENVIVGAGSVVTKNISEKNSIYAGVPAKKLNK